MLRLAALFAALISIVLLMAGAGGAAGSAPSPTPFVGEWTPDTSSAGAVASQVFTISESDENAARQLSGTNAANYDDYCNSNYPGVEPVTYFAVDTTGSGNFGGCVSGKTGGHIYTWNTGQVWYAHTATLKGEPVLNGTLEVEHGGGNNTNYKFRAHRPVVKFLAKAKYTTIGKISELTTLTGVGELAVARQPGNCLGANLVGGTGAITLRIVKVGGPSLVELDDVTVALEPASGDYYPCDTQEFLRDITVSVKKSDPAEKDSCPVDSPGTLTFVDRSAKYKGDFLILKVPKCHLAVNLAEARAKKGSHVAMAVTFDEKGY